MVTSQDKKIKVFDNLIPELIQFRHCLQDLKGSSDCPRIYGKDLKLTVRHFFQWRGKYSASTFYQVNIASSPTAVGFVSYFTGKAADLRVASLLRFRFWQCIIF